MKNIRNTAKICSLLAILALSSAHLYSEETPVTQSYIDSLKAAAYKAGAKAQKVGAVFGVTGDNLTWLGHKAVNVAGALKGAELATRAGAVLSGLSTEQGQIKAFAKVAAAKSEGEILYRAASGLAPLAASAAIGAGAGWYLSNKALDLLSKAKDVLLEDDESEISKEEARKAIADAQEMIADAHEATDLSDAATTTA